MTSVPLNTKQNAQTTIKTLEVFLARYGLVLIVLALLGTFAVLRPDTYLTVRNLLSIASSQAIVALLSLAILGVLIVGEFDLSFAALMGLCQVLIIGIVSQATLPWATIAAGLILVGCAVGLFNAFLIRKLYVSSFVATMGLATILGGIGMGYSGGAILTGNLPDSFYSFGQGSLLGIDFPVWYVVIVAIALYILFEHTVVGRHMRAVGDNRAAARLIGINISRVVAIAFVLAGGISAFAAVVSGSQLGSGQPMIAMGYLLPAYAGAFLGLTTITPGRFNVWGTLVGVFLLGAGVSGLQQLGFAPWVQDLFNGAMLLIAVSLSGFLNKSHRRRAL
ncbi:ABC transporter permease [Brucella sp. NBRC 12950]|uniref:ABC transporter permease n=1 Tax=Brucella sp. NBRC 12950 TaxID=2994518 RepID=UPI0024A59049|nr:ABC transporter permease [Brucella sp. NBRC 12950]GLU29846.1 sugar ABC transporter permease [Brucella sp. NBRC 12950]